MIQCNNHNNLQANNLCIKCGNWYCNSCMSSLVPVPICKSCANDSLKTSDINLIQFINLKLPTIPNNLLLIGFGISFLSFLMLTITIHQLFLLPLIIVFVVALILFVINKKKENLNGKTITEAQIRTLLKMTSNRLTIIELSEKTNVNLDLAENKLKEMFVNGKLEMSEENGVIFYSSRELL